MNDKVKKLIQQLTGLAYLVSNNTEHDVFVNYSGHCNSFDLSYSPNGWVREGNNSIKILGLYLDTNQNETVEQLEKAKLVLYQLLEEAD